MSEFLRQICLHTMMQIQRRFSVTRMHPPANDNEDES